MQGGSVFLDTAGPSGCVYRMKNSKSAQYVFTCSSSPRFFRRCPCRFIRPGGLSSHLVAFCGFPLCIFPCIYIENYAFFNRYGFRLRLHCHGVTLLSRLQDLKKAILPAPIQPAPVRSLSFPVVPARPFRFRRSLGAASLLYTPLCFE